MERPGRMVGSVRANAYSRCKLDTARGRIARAYTLCTMMMMTMREKILNKNSLCSLVFIGISLRSYVDGKTGVAVRGRALRGHEALGRLSFVVRLLPGRRVAGRGRRRFLVGSLVRKSPPPASSD